jgi:multiple sugar transport system substrate-binding protein
MDINRFDKTAMDDLKGYSDKGELAAVPFSIGFSVLFYNKDIFDKFGVPYPKEGMNWDDIVSLSKRLQRKDGSVQYFAINPVATDLRKFGSPFSMPIIDPKTDKAVINTEGWKKVFQQLKMITDLSDGNVKYPSFADGQTMAMYASYGDYFGTIEKTAEKAGPFDWDITTMPSFKDAPGVGFRSLSHTLSISSTSVHKDDAFKVIQCLVSDENQLAMAKRGIRFPSIDDQKLKDSFGVDNPMLKGKNLQAIFKTKPAPNPRFTKYDSIIEKQLNSAFSLVRDNKTDINTALRDAEEKANQGIADAKTGK